MPSKKKVKIDTKDTGGAGIFQELSDALHALANEPAVGKPAPTPKVSDKTKKIMESKKATGGKKGANIRAGSVGVSSSSRQRTKKRGPQYR